MKNMVLIGERYRKQLERALEREEIEVFWLPDNPSVDPRLAGHADLSVLALTDKRIVLSRSFVDSEKESEQIKKLVNILTNRGYCVLISDYPQGKKYPADVNLCAAIVGDHVIHNEKYCDKLVLHGSGLKFVNVRQGYCNCSVCVLNDNSIITSDKGIALAAEKHGISALKIDEGFFLLDGYSTGFIGGSSFVIGCKLYFTGSIAAHPSFAAILSFAFNRGLTTISLTDARSFDIGGAVVV